MENKEKIAREFSRILRETITPAQMILVIERVRSKENVYYYAGSEYCNHNMVMWDAYTNIMGIDSVQPDSDDHVELWEQALELARRELFYTKK